MRVKTHRGKKRGGKGEAERSDRKYGGVAQEAEARSASKGEKSCGGNGKTFSRLSRRKGPLGRRGEAQRDKKKRDCARPSGETKLDRRDRDR